MLPRVDQTTLFDVHLLVVDGCASSLFIALCCHYAAQKLCQLNSIVSALIQNHSVGVNISVSGEIGNSQVTDNFLFGTF